MSGASCRLCLRTWRALGYQTVSIHPNRPDFYNRQNVYESFGFEEFLSLEDFADPVYHGYFVSEQSFSNKIKETFAERLRPDPSSALASASPITALTAPPAWSGTTISAGTPISSATASIRS